MHVGVAVVVESVCESASTMVVIIAFTAVAVTTATTGVAIVIVVMRLTRVVVAAIVDLSIVGSNGGCDRGCR